jgi:hypothetical protein
MAKAAKRQIGETVTRGAGRSSPSLSNRPARVTNDIVRFS